MTVEAVVTWLDELIDKNTDQPPILVAHSLLGVFVMGYAVEHGDQFRRLIPVVTPGLGKFRPNEPRAGTDREHDQTQSWQP